MKYFVLKNSTDEYYFETFDIQGMTTNIFDAKFFEEGDASLDHGDIARIEIEELCDCKFKNVEIEIKEII